MTKRSVDGVYRRPDSPYWWYSFQLDGQANRVRKSTGTADHAAALTIYSAKRTEAAKQLALGVALDPSRHQALLDDVLARFWQEVAQHQPSAEHTARLGKRLIGFFGETFLLTELTNDAVARWVTHRRAKVSNATVNRELLMMGAIVHRAERVWGYDSGRVAWPRHKLPYPKHRERILDPDEQDRLFSRLRPDFHGIVRFALLTGLRRNNVTQLTWSQVSWIEGVIRVRVKSKDPSGKLVVLPITAEIAELLACERGRHPQRVFTYILTKDTFDKTTRTWRRKGDRLPFSHYGWYEHWWKALAEAGLEDVRFHDLRHTAAVEMLRGTGDIYDVKNFLGHSSLQMTERYLIHNQDDLRRAMEKTAAYRTVSRERHVADETPEKTSKIKLVR